MIPSLILATALSLGGPSRPAPATAPHRPPARHRVVIDTDVGPDDLMAIAFLLGRPDVRIDAVVVETGLTRVNAGADIVLRLLHLAHADSIPVYLGAAAHIQKTRFFPQAWIDQTEQQGAAAASPAIRHAEAKSATEFLAGVLAKSHQTADSATDLLLLGPVTNIALAIRRVGAPNVRPIRTVIMGGAVDAGGNLNGPDTQTDNTKAEWNLFSDPAAARAVFTSPLRIELIALDATQHVKIDAPFVRAIAAGAPSNRRTYVEKILDAARDWVERGDYYAWDPFAAVALVDPSVATFAAMKLAVDVDGQFPGRTRRAANGSSVSVARTADRGRFLRVFNAALDAVR